MKPVTLSLPVFLIVCLTAGANTYYVAPSGSDQNAGTEAAPFANIQKGVNAAQPGDTVRVAPGVYRETVRIPWSTTTAPQVLTARVGSAGGSVYEAWCELGRPENLTTGQTALLLTRSEPVWFLAPAAVGKDARLTSAEWADWDKKMGELSR
jgi:hypothetical protein